MSIGERGSALLEVMVALTVLAIAGLAIVEATRTALGATAAARVTEERLLDMDRLLRAHTLLDRRDLGQRTGRRAVGPYVFTIDRLDLELFRVSVGLPGEAPELSTVLYRPGAGDE